MIDPKTYQLHIFCDDSLRAYGAVAYLRVCSSSEIHCSLLMCKVRQTPLDNKSLRTVPRIELNAAKLAITLKVLICREVSHIFGSVFYWSAGTTVLKYINSDTARFHSFVENRIFHLKSF